jgi:hypothetical protein
MSRSSATRALVSGAAADWDAAGCGAAIRMSVIPVLLSMDRPVVGGGYDVLMDLERRG